MKKEKEESRGRNEWVCDLYCDGGTNAEKWDGAQTSHYVGIGGYFFGITPNLSTIWYEKVIGKYRCFWICIFSFFYPGYCYTC
ncbi:hypothetical protein V6Z12_D01G164400 [Gossypium hirsutum]